ncbi:MAG: tetratricopeptide repeat-containing sensor histidine kinase [Flagellimonas sp.]
MKNGVLIIVLLLVLGCRDKASTEETVRNPKVDSIQQLLNIAKTAKELSSDERRVYIQDAEAQVLTLSKDSTRLEQLSQVSLAYLKLKDSMGFRQSNAKLLKLSEEADASKISGYSNWDLGDFFETYGVMDSAFYHYRKALESFDRLPKDSTSQSLKARMLYSMSRVQDSYKDYLGGETSATAAIEIFDELDDDYRLYNAYNMLGTLANGLGNSQKAIESYETAREYIENSNRKNKTRLIWQLQNNVASIYLNKEDFKKAKENFKQLLTNKELKEDAAELYEKVLGSYAFSLLKTDNNTKKAEELLQEAFTVNSATGELYDRARLHYFYSEVLAAKGDTLNAIANADESYNIAKETYNNDRALDALRLLTRLDMVHAASYAEEYYQLNEAIQEEERTKRDKFGRIRMETDDIIEENQILTKEKKVWVYSAVLLIVFGIIFMAIASLYHSNSQLKFKQKQQESNQEIYNLMLSQQGKFEEGKQLEQKRISEELHDGILSEMLGIRLILSGLNEREDQASIDQRAALIEKLRDLEEEIRTISHELNHAAYKKFHNFIVSLKNMVADIEKSSGISCSFTYDDKVQWDNLLGDIKINAYRIIQESLKNCVKHAKSENVSVLFQLVEDKLKLTITDDGVGFNINKRKKGIGLKNIISRAKKIKAELDVDSKPGKGTTIKVTIPVEYVDVKTSKETDLINA